jgi:adenosylcobinamide-phosphate synthase
LRPITLPLAPLLDILMGDPPNRLHPVAWMGTAIAEAQQRAPKDDHREQFIYGGLIALGGAGIVFLSGKALSWVIGRLPRPFNWLAEALILELMLSMRGLSSAANDIQAALDSGDLPEAQRLTHWHLVSRDTSQLSESQVAAATIESVAENTSDGILAPLWYYALLGLPGALAYRFANTADAMLGYRDAEREWLGKIPAWLDDLLNLIPARLTGLLFVAAAWITGDDAKNAWFTWRRDRTITASPNAGHPMSAAAGALGVELEKVNHYTLGSGGRSPSAKDIGRSVRLMRAAVWLGVGVLMLIPLLRQRK